jgi:hypothetical protein
MKIFVLTLSLALSFKTLAQAPLKIIHVGDSQSVGHYGSQLNQHLKTIPGAEVSSFASGGSGAENWVTGKATEWDYYEHRHGQTKPVRKKNQPTPRLDVLLKNDKEIEQVAVVQLGGNMLARSDEYNKEWIKKVVDAIKNSGSRCIWVGPSNRRTNSDKMANFYRLLTSSLKESDCYLVDSRKYTSYPRVIGDGVHFNYFGGDLVTSHWAKKTFDELTAHLAQERFADSQEK